MNPYSASRPREPESSMATTTMTDERRLLVALADPHQDDSLLRYAAYWAQLHHPAVTPRTPAGACAISCSPEPLLGATFLASTTAQGRDLFVAAPQAIQTFRITAAEERASAALLEQAANPGIAALAVGERRLACDLVRRAPCSVWFVPDSAQPAPRRVLVPIDFSVPAADSLRVAATLACLSGADECLALHVYFNDCYLTGTWGERAARQAAGTAFDRFMKPIDTLGVKVTPCFREAANVAEAVNETAAELQADLIVLASRGRSWSASWLQATLAEQTLHTCRIPLLVVKHFGAARGLRSLLVELLRSPAVRLGCN